MSILIKTRYDMLEKINLMSHTYEETVFKEVVEVITKKYYYQIQNLYNFFKIQ